MNKIIGVDIDDTLSKSYELLINICNERLGTSFQYEKITEYYFSSIPEFRCEEINWHELYMDVLANEHDRFQPIDESKPILQGLKDSGHAIIAITARQPAHESNTKKWLNGHFQTLIDDVCFLGTSETYKISKAEACKKLGVEFMVEDHLDHCLDLAHNGVKTFLLERPWNRHRTETHPLITKVKSWGEIHSHLTQNG